MKHLLDNPIYQALSTHHQKFSEGTENVRFYHREVAHFAGLKDHSKEDFKILHQFSCTDGPFIIFSPVEVHIPEQWKLMRQINMFQLSYEHDFVPAGDDDMDLVDLKEEHVEEMIALVELTQPGPFLTKTINLSNYTGVFEDGKLVAMAGHRFHPHDYIEVSAVCTHPDYLGKGYAYGVIREQIKRILQKSAMPFLHVRNDHVGAIKLYKKLGFKIRTDMTAYVIAKI